LLYLQKPFHPYEIRQFASTLAARWKAEKMTQSLNQNLESMVESRTAELRKAYKQLEYQASHDSLTELLNRRAIFEVLRREISRINRTNNPITIILTDIDHFKSINDTYGHSMGDAVLVETAKRLKEGIRPYDSVGRIGGEEFLVVLPECNSEDGMVVAERIRASVARDLFIIPGQTFSITTSVGLATTSPGQTIEPDSLITAADQALYRAKREGRNRITIICENGLGSFA
jgi:diguanylate cyclase (GGDEF)-like protein